MSVVGSGGGGPVGQNHHQHQQFHRPKVSQDYIRKSTGRDDTGRPEKTPNKLVSMYKSNCVFIF